MQTVYVSELIITSGPVDPPELARDESVLALPTCPLCQEKLDSSATGLSAAATILHEAFISGPNKNK